MLISSMPGEEEGLRSASSVVVAPSDINAMELPLRSKPPSAVDSTEGAAPIGCHASNERRTSISDAFKIQTGRKSLTY